jgi:hypothetical protein
VNGWVGNDSLTPFGTFIIYTDPTKRLILRLFYGFYKPKLAKCARSLLFIRIPQKAYFKVILWLL